MKLQLEVEKSGLAEDQLGLAKKAWDFIKWSFNDEEVHPYLARVDAEKTTAPFTVDIFAAYEEAPPWYLGCC